MIWFSQFDNNGVGVLNKLECILHYENFAMKKMSESISDDNILKS